MAQSTPEIRPDHVAIYIRWSTDDQANGTTLDVQLDGCRHYLLSQGWQYRPDLLFLDDGWSGGNLNRPAMTKLRAAAQAGAVDCVVVFKIDRLSRNVVDTVNLVLREWDGRCYVKSAREAIDTSSPAGKMFFYTLVSFAEWERSVIRDRTLAGKLRRLQEGKNPGFRPPFGLRTGATPGTFVLVPEEAQVVSRIFDQYLEGKGYSAIAADLNRQGVLFREGRAFTARTVAEILHNPIYTGQLVYGRRGKGRTPVVVDQTQVPAIISPTTYGRAEQLRLERAEQRQPSRSVASDHLLTGLLRCRCQSSMIGIRTAAETGGVAYYVCTGKRNKGAGFCDCGHIRQDELDRWVVERLVERYAPLVSLARYSARAGLETEMELKNLERAQAATERELAGLTRERTVVARDYRQERISPAEYREQRQLVEARQSELQQRKAALADKALLLRRHLASACDTLAAVPVSARWDLLSRQDQKRLLRTLIRSLTVYRPPGSATLEFQLEWIAPETVKMPDA